MLAHFFAAKREYNKENFSFRKKFIQLSPMTIYKTNGEKKNSRVFLIARNFIMLALLSESRLIIQRNFQSIYDFNSFFRLRLLKIFFFFLFSSLLEPLARVSIFNREKNKDNNNKFIDSSLHLKAYLYKR